MQINIPNYKTLELHHLVLDYNGTIAKDGILKEEVQRILPQLTQIIQVHIITADTFGNVLKQVENFDVKVEILQSSDHTLEKSLYIQSLQSAHCAAIGNGNNDAKMLQEAELGIAILGDEGCGTQTLLQSDVSVKNIADALELFLHPKRLIATLRV